MRVSRSTITYYSQCKCELASDPHRTQTEIDITYLTWKNMIFAIHFKLINRYVIPFPLHKVLCMTNAMPIQLSTPMNVSDALRDDDECDDKRNIVRRQHHNFSLFQCVATELIKIDS